MNRISLSIYLILFSVSAFAQVGIGTNAPKTTLDVAYSQLTTTADGVLIPRMTGNELKAKDNLYGSAHNSTLVYVTAVPSTTSTKTSNVNDSGFYAYDGSQSKWVKMYDYMSPVKSFVKGGSSGSISVLNVNLSSTYKKIKFDQTDFDENNEFDVSNNVFTAKQSGIYSIYVQIETNSVISTGDVGVAVFKDSSGTISLIAEENYSATLSNSLGILGGLGISLSGTVKSPPTRKTQTMVKLNKGEKIYFGVTNSLLNITLIGGSKSFFTIEQVK